MNTDWVYRFMLKKTCRLPLHLADPNEDLIRTELETEKIKRGGNSLLQGSRDCESSSVTVL